jgi:uncharacterized protein (TIGR03663 family)
MKQAVIWSLWVAVVIGACVLRVAQLSQRPLHTDEAVHAQKLGDLLGPKGYEYDLNEYHGPTLNYFSLLLAKLRGQHTYASLDEATLRLIPVAFGLILVFLPVLLRKGLEKRSVYLMCTFCAFSPAFVYYSRYYIMEMLLVCFTFCFIVCVWRYLQNPGLFWALCAGLSAGLMHATKETCVIAWGCMAGAALVVSLTHRKTEPAKARSRLVFVLHIALACVAALGISALFYSSFGKHPTGIADSFRTYAVYFNRAGREGVHHHAWYYYLDLLTWIEFLEWPGWNEDFVLVFALLGLYWAFTRKPGHGTDVRLIRFLAVYTLLMTIVYSVIPYKTPWCLLGFLHGMIILSGYAAAELIKAAAGPWEKRLAWALIVALGVISPLGQAYWLSFRADTDTANPYVYAHTHRDVLDVVHEVQALAKVPNADKGKNTIHVICPGDDCWPLPWYLRNFSTDLGEIGYWSQVDFNEAPGDIILFQPPVEADIVTLLFEKTKLEDRELYMSLFNRLIQLRPGVELRAYVRKGLWELADAIEDDQIHASQ